MAGVVAAALTGFVAIGAGLAAIVLAVFGDVVPFADFAFAIGAGAFGFGHGCHGANT
jgi:hypothetical protein